MRSWQTRGRWRGEETRAFPALSLFPYSACGNLSGVQLQVENPSLAEQPGEPCCQPPSVLPKARRRDGAGLSPRSLQLSRWWDCDLSPLHCSGAVTLRQAAPRGRSGPSRPLLRCQGTNGSHASSLSCLSQGRRVSATVPATYVGSGAWMGCPWGPALVSWGAEMLRRRSWEREAPRWEVDSASFQSGFSEPQCHPGLLDSSCAVQAEQCPLPQADLPWLPPRGD